jgi:hypothetical protein
LQENQRILEDQKDFFKKSAVYSEYLRNTDEKLLNRDSLANYDEIARWINNPVFKSNAMEMFKTSGAMRYLIKDQAFLLLIWDTYSFLEILKDYSNLYFNLKTEYSLKSVDKTEPAILYDFHKIHGFSGDMFKITDKTLKFVDSTINKLETY